MVTREKSKFEGDLEKLEAYVADASWVVRLVRDAAFDDWGRATAAEVQKNVGIIVAAIERDEPAGACIGPFGGIFEFLRVKTCGARPDIDCSTPEKSRFEDDLGRLEAFTAERAGAMVAPGVFDVSFTEQVNVSRAVRLVRSAVFDDWKRARAADVQKNVGIVADAVEHDEAAGVCLVPLAGLLEFLCESRT